MWLILFWNTSKIKSIFHFFVEIQCFGAAGEFLMAQPVKSDSLTHESTIGVLSHHKQRWKRWPEAGGQCSAPRRPPSQPPWRSSGSELQWGRWLWPCRCNRGPPPYVPPPSWGWGSLPLSSSLSSWRVEETETVSAWPRPPQGWWRPGSPQQQRPDNLRRRAMFVSYSKTNHTNDFLDLQPPLVRSSSAVTRLTLY